ncbi:hypothetical protein C1646_752577 [Rhizophagus diaphanus]|nr:hypothetical protein C1646_752577 [Rhizophagus diaphanus] [Rhizophagus sp. MUCL 43196]
MRFKEYGGFCLSDNYINNITPLNRSIAKHTLENARKIAHSRNRKWLSEKYINCMTALLWHYFKDLLWKYVKGHIWHATLNAIKDQNTWCSFCPKYKREKLYCEILTEYLGSPSLTRRSEFLKTQEHLNGLELDILYPQYGFAIKDQLKRELCEENQSH